VNGGTAPDEPPGTVVTPVPGDVPPGTVVTPVLPGVGNCTRGCANAETASKKQTVQIPASNLIGLCTTSESTRVRGERIRNGAINYQDRQIGSREIIGTEFCGFVVVSSKFRRQVFTFLSNKGISVVASIEVPDFPCWDVSDSTTRVSSTRSYLAMP